MVRGGEADQEIAQRPRYSALDLRISAIGIRHGQIFIVVDDNCMTVVSPY